MIAPLRWLAVFIAFGWSTVTVSADAPPAPWRDRPFYPGLYMTLAYERDARDAVFDSRGQRVESAVPTFGGDTAFPESRVQMQLSWYFPLFEAYGIPFVSDHLFTSRIRLGYQDTRTDGALNDFIATNPDVVPQTGRGGGGLEDVTFEWGSFLVGGRNWRNSPTLDDRFSVLALVGLTVPVGRYDRQAPISPGDNALAWHTRLGLQWQPWIGSSLDGGFAYRWHARNSEPAFGGLAPARQGDDLMVDLSFTQRLVRRLHVTAFAAARETGANEYSDLRYAPNTPPPTVPLLGTSRYLPAPGTYRDDGARLFNAGASVHVFLTQNLLASLSYTRPVSGRSGQFLLPFNQEQCLPGAGSGAITCAQFRIRQLDAEPELQIQREGVVHMHGLRIMMLRAVALAAGLCAASAVPAAVLAPPLLGEFGKPLPGSSAAFIGFATTRGNRYFGPDGLEFGVGDSSTNIEFIAAGMGWSDTWFSGTPIPFLKDRIQSCGFSVSAAHIQDEGRSVQTARGLGLNAGSNQIGNPSISCSVSDFTRRIGPVKGHLQFGVTALVPVGGFEADNLYNLGTRYWTVVPRLGLHAEWGRLITDSFVAYQANSSAREVATLGLTPSRPADWRSAALNIGYRLTPRWLADIGYAYNASVGSNQYDEVDIHNAQPVGVDSCATYGLPPGICASAAAFYFQSRPGPYTDSGSMVRTATASLYYTYRSSMFVVFRASRTLAGRSGNFTGNFDLCIEKDCGPANAISQFSGPITAAAVGSGTVYALTLVFPMGAP